jgi:hypothetical protein
MGVDSEGELRATTQSVHRPERSAESLAVRHGYACTCDLRRRHGYALAQSAPTCVREPCAVGDCTFLAVPEAIANLSRSAEINITILRRVKGKGSRFFPLPLRIRPWRCSGKPTLFGFASSLGWETRLHG